MNWNQSKIIFFPEKAYDDIVYKMFTFKCRSLSVLNTGIVQSGFEILQ